MAASIPNMFANQQSPLGAAFANLSRVLASGPSEAERYKEADEAVLTRRKVTGQEGVASRFRGMYPQGLGVAPAAPQSAPQGPQMAEPQQMQELPASMQIEGPSLAASPIARAFASTAPKSPAAPQPETPDYGALIGDAVYAGMKPDDLGGYNLFGAANSYGPRDQRTVNATVGAGKNFDTTAEAFDTTERNKIGMNDADNATSITNNRMDNDTSRDNNVLDNQTSRYNNNADNAAMDRRAKAQLTSMAQGAAMDDTTITYAADIYRNTGQLPPLGMGRAAGALRVAIITKAAQRDAALGRDGSDAAHAFVDNQGNRSAARTLGTREANAGMAVNELKSFIPISKQAIADVSRTGFLPFDQLVQAYQKNTNDPALRKAVASLQATENAYARAISPNGVPTDQSRSTAHEMLNSAYNLEALNVTLDQMGVEADAALRAPEQTRAQMHDAMRNNVPQPGAAPHQNPAPQGGEEHWARGKDGKMHRVK